VRFTTLFAVNVIAVLMLTACSGDARPGTVPAGFQAPPASVQPAARDASRATNNVKCPVQYVQCVTISYSTPVSVSLACTYCGSYYPYWGGAVYKKKSGELFKHITSNFSPDPGNPTTDTMTETRPVKPSNGHVRYIQQYDFCISGNCSDTFEIGIVTE
jgi:hypothetical protein